MKTTSMFITFGLLCCQNALADEKVVSMSTTTSTQASGLLDILLPAFQKETGIKVKVIAKGTGAAIRDGKDGNVDLIFVHAKSREQAFVAEQFGTKRYAVMHNDFVILGPKKDPAKIKGCQSASLALAKIYDAGALFVSRADDSGTHTKEQALWKETGRKLEENTSTIIKKGKKTAVTSIRPRGIWYLSIGQGMGKALTYADEKQAYVLADRGTYLKFRYGKKPALDLVLMSAGDPLLHNPYGVIPTNPKRHPHVKHKLADKLAQWLVGPQAQQLIANYKYSGKQLFYPDAIRYN